MMQTTAVLARAITWAGSKQTYYIARLMVDKDLVDDFFRAYAYFRWVDDIVDAPVSSHGLPRSDGERISFIKRQGTLIDQLYRNERPDSLAPEEEMIADLISHSREEHSGLRSFIRNMFAIIEFDALRKGRLISQQELAWYTDCLSKAVVDGLQYFIGNRHPYPAADNRYPAASAAHIAHMLRDTIQDTSDGFINIPGEYLEAHGIGPDDVDSPPFRTWVQKRVELARRRFPEGKHYLDELDVLRCSIVGHWYCARFECVLNAIDRDGYILRTVYKERYRLSSWLRIIWLGVSVTLRHIARRGRRLSGRKSGVRKTKGVELAA
jgi:phytoene/squalene synthetase